MIECSSPFQWRGSIERFGLMRRFMWGWIAITVCPYGFNELFEGLGRAGHVVLAASDAEEGNCRMTETPTWLVNFVRESNRIEGILREPTPDEIRATEVFVLHEIIAPLELQTLVSVLQPGAILRRSKGLNVSVGNHVAPKGGPKIKEVLMDILGELPTASAHNTHHRYETLHPFTDGNGRSGRALWLWRMLRGTERESLQARELGFLHTWYYQSLEASR